MPTRQRLLGAAFGGAAAVTVLWFILNAWTVGAVAKIVRELGWPVSSYWLAAAAGAIIGMISSSRGRRAKLRHSNGAAQAAAELALTYLPTIERPLVALPCLVS